MQNPQLNEWLKNKEWYDNHKLSTILACQRKAFLSMLYKNQGLAIEVGTGAFFGTCTHAALAKYYFLQDKLNETGRRMEALKTFAREYENLFLDLLPEKVPKKHSLENGLDIIDAYCDRWLPQDHKYRTVEVELAGILPIKPSPGDPPDFVEEFYFIFRADRVVERIETGDWWIVEIKTASNVKSELAHLLLARQPRGYVYALHQWEPAKIKGFIPDIIGIYVEKKEFEREYVYCPAPILQSWRIQTINIVQRWRSILNKQKLVPSLDNFVQDDGECTRYGLCQFYDICRYGLHKADQMKLNTWTPFQLSKKEE